jgi:signal transduction histidine kinase
VKQMVTLDVDDAALEVLAELGPPSEVLSLLVDSIAEGALRPASVRQSTNESLRTERARSDEVLALGRDASTLVAQKVLEVARSRAGRLLEDARERAARMRTTTTADARDLAREQASAEERVEDERVVAAAALDSERGRAELQRNVTLTAERRSTNRDLVGERAASDSITAEQREANAHMLSAAMRIQEVADAEMVARVRAEEHARNLSALAELRETFIGILGHDLRNPLASVIMAANLLVQRGRLDERDQMAAARIIKNSERMSRMIMQLLDVTHARLGGGLPLDRRRTDLSEICRNIVDEFGGTIELEIDGDLTGDWDGDRLSEVLSNLAGNALEHATPGTTVTIAARTESNDAVLEVSNQGPPIPADVLPFIFEPFRRAKQREKSNAGNLGLGLFIANQAVIAHGGTLSAQSVDGTTTFTVRLPRTPPH